MNPDRNKIQAGIFVLSGIALAIVVIVLLSDLGRFFAATQQIVVRYSLADGVAGLGEGSTVSVGGVPEGAVTRIEDVTDPDQDGVVVAKDVTFTIPAGYEIYENARIELVIPVFGAGTSLNIASFGYDAGPDVPGYEGQGWAYQPDETITGGIGDNPMVKNLTKNMGIGDQQREQIQQTIASMQKFTQNVEARTQEINEIVADVQAFVAMLEERGPGAADELDATLADARQLIADAKKGVADANAGIAEAKAVVADARKRWEGAWAPRVDTITKNVDTTSAEIRGAVEENRPVVKRTIAKAETTVANADAVIERFKTESLPEIEKSIEAAGRAIADAEQTTGEIKRAVVTQRPTLERMLANLRIASNQLKLATIEVRRSPWRLLYTPSDEELESDNLYDAARSFADAASTLDNSSESLRALMERYGDKIDPEDDDLKLLVESLRESFEKYHQAETKFWKALDEQTKQ